METTSEPVAKDRTRIIGGSDIAAVMGLSRWKTPLALWAEKTGKINNDLSNFEAAEIGIELEEYVAIWFQRVSGLRLRRDSRTFKHPDYPYMVAHIDRWVMGDDSVFEAKTTSARNEKEWQGEDGIPVEYVLQCNWYLGILKKKKAHIAVLIGGQKRLRKEIHFDQGLFDSQVEAARNFMENFVLNDTPPVALADDQETLALLFPEAKDQTLLFDGEKAETIDSLIVKRNEGIAAKKSADAQIDDAEAKIKQFLGDAAIGETESNLISWKSVKRAAYQVAEKEYRQLRTKKKEVA